MRYLLSVLTLLAWALWLGGLGALFLFVAALFASSREVAIQAAPAMFVSFERYRLVVASAGLLFGAALWVVARPRAMIAFLGLLLLASIAALVSAIVITPRLEILRHAGKSHTPEFRRLHGQSTALYVAQTGVLVVAGFLLPAALRAGSIDFSPRRRGEYGDETE